MMFLSCIVPSFLSPGSLLVYSVVKVLQKSSYTFAFDGCEVALNEYREAFVLNNIFSYGV